MNRDVLKELTQEETKGLVLLPCPFCGAPGVALSREYTTQSRLKENSARFSGYECIGSTTKTRIRKEKGKLIEEEIVYWSFRRKRYTVCCSNKSCLARRTVTEMADVRDAAARWNRRAGK